MQQPWEGHFEREQVSLSQGRFPGERMVSLKMDGDGAQIGFARPQISR